MTASHWLTLMQRIEQSLAWQQKITNAGLSLAELQSCGSAAVALRSLPELSREELLRGGTDWLALTESDSQDFEWAWSSGSSSTPPLLVARSGADRDRRWSWMQTAFESRGGNAAQLRRGAFLCALPGRPEYATHADSQRQIPIERIRLEESTSVYRRLQRVRADFWNLSPIGLAWLLRSMPHPLHPSPQVIFSTALHLPLPLRREAEQRLNCPVIDLYSTAETGPLACACPDSDQNFHIFAPEIDVALDAFGLLVTRHSDAILPLLNYRIQDYAENLAPRCSKCTHIGPTLLGFRGRTVSTKGEHSRAAQALSAVPL